MAEGFCLKLSYLDRGTEKFSSALRFSLSSSRSVWGW